MATAGDLHTLDQGRTRGARLRQSHGETISAVGPAGPFGIASPPARPATTRDTLVTALLVIYPALATVAAIVVGLALTGGV